MARNEMQLLPEFTAELEYIKNNGADIDIIQKIIQKHLPNSRYNKMLYKRLIKMVH